MQRRPRQPRRTAQTACSAPRSELKGRSVSSYSTSSSHTMRRPRATGPGESRRGLRQFGVLPDRWWSMQCGEAQRYRREGVVLMLGRYGGRYTAGSRFGGVTHERRDGGARAARRHATARFGDTSCCTTVSR